MDPTPAPVPVQSVLVPVPAPVVAAPPPPVVRPVQAPLFFNNILIFFYNAFFP